MFDITDDPDKDLKLTKTLPDIESERQALERRVEVERLAQEKVEEERQCANDYVQSLITELPNFLKMTDRVDVDKALLKFASDFCAEVAEQQKRQETERDYIRVRGSSFVRSDSSSSGSTSMLILNADGVYVATYYTLLLNLKLIGSRYYENNGGRLPLTQKQFIEEIHDSGVLVYLSSTWLSELYKLIISCNILGESGYSTQDARVNNALVLMLTGEFFSEEPTGSIFLNEFFVTLVKPFEIVLSVTLHFEPLLGHSERHRKIELMKQMVSSLQFHV